MKFVYKPFHLNEEIEAFFNEINNYIYSPVEGWYREKGLKLYGCFYSEESKMDILFCFGQTICSDTLLSPSENTIFSKLKLYGSSCKYKGLKDIRGKVLLRNMYDDIDFFYATQTDAYFIVRKDVKKGVYKFTHDKLEVISQFQFEDLFDAGEYTCGYIKNGMLVLCPLKGN